MPDEQGQGSEQGTVTILYAVIVHLVGLDAGVPCSHMDSRSWPEHSKKLSSSLTAVNPSFSISYYFQ